MAISSGNLINAGGGFLFLLAGLVILAVARQTRLGRRLGAFAVTFGLSYGAGNLVDPSVNMASFVALILIGLLAAVCLGALIVEVWRQMSRAARPRVALLTAGLGLGAALAGILAVIYLTGLERITADHREFFVVFPQQFLIEPFLLALLAASAQAPPAGSLQQYKGRLMLGLAAGLFAGDIIMGAAASTYRDEAWEAAGRDGVELLFGVMVAFTAWLVLRGRPPGAERFARRAFLAIVLIGLAGCLHAVFANEVDAIGPYGILRTAGAVLLVLAVVKYDLLGVPLPRLVVRRGVLANGALAVLFIGAQIAQNFFSAQYSLLTGGVLAGAFLFAASPIQRAIERATDRQKANHAATESAIAGYKAALRAAMRDGTLTRREERHLAEVALALGITPVQALDLRDDVEREHA